jgi:hypothetical protein
MTVATLCLWLLATRRFWASDPASGGAQRSWTLGNRTGVRPPGHRRERQHRRKREPIPCDRKGGVITRKGAVDPSLRSMRKFIGDSE